MDVPGGDWGLAASTVVSIVFNEPVTGFGREDLDPGPDMLLSHLSSAGDATHWSATLAADSNAALAGSLALDLTGVHDLAGNTGIGTVYSNRYSVPASVSTLALSGIDLDKSTLAAGAQAGVGFRFNQPVQGFDANDVTAPGCVLSAPVSTDGGASWRATLTPKADTQSAANKLTVDLSGLYDMADKPGQGSASGANYRVDTVAPVLRSAALNGRQLVLEYSEGGGLNAANLPDAAAFSVLANGHGQTVSNITANANATARTVTLTLTSAMATGQQLSIGYGAPGPGQRAVRTAQATALPALSTSR